MAELSPPAQYEVRATFRAPLPFVFRWCTDYSPEDPTLEKEKFERRILLQKGRKVVYEDLTDTGDGWMWSRTAVTLQPPNRWHADAMGNYRTWSLDYELRSLSDGRTELRLQGVRRATALGKNPPKARLERELRVTWANYAAALERDYRASTREA
ncbi:MAG: hypothetical protein L3K00_01080 [Thermoplasmata archaeon]|nr:hypothetical protein [Thermoplasmata archaeon]MCI4361920.1 hypothetical protein [Thermoplasmata archaeon]